MSEQNNGTIRSSFWSNLFGTSSGIMDLRNTLLAIPVFKGLTGREISSVTNLMHERNYIKGEYIFYQDDPGIGMYIIREGTVEIKRAFENKETLSLALLNKGDFFGELALIDGEKRSASAIAVDDSKLAVIFKPDLDEFVDKFPKTGTKILQGINQVVIARLRKLNEDIISLQVKLKIKSEEVYGT